jgi:hypothetical protein
VASTDAVARITKIYDQIGSANVTFSYATAAGFIVSGVSGKPTGMCVQARSSQGTATISALSGNISFGTTFERYARFTSYAAMITDNGSSLAIGNPGTANKIWAQVFGLTEADISATDGTSTADFSHFHRAMLTIVTAAGGSNAYVDGNAPTAETTSGTTTTGTTMALCGYTGNFAATFFTNGWADNATASSVQAEAATSLTTVPLP